jgi:hypothetical protein
MGIDQLIADMQQKYDFDVQVTSKSKGDGSSLIKIEVELTPKPLIEEAKVSACYEAMKKALAAIAASFAEDFAVATRKTHSSSP